MAINELTQEIEKTEQERRKRYPLLELVNDREEIRNIAEATLEYQKTLYPSLEELDMWEIIPRVTMEFMSQLFSVAEQKKSTENCVMVSLGEFFSIGVEYGETKDADKDGTFNPIITVGPELAYDNENPDNNKLKQVPPVFSPDDQEMIDFVAKNTQNVCKTRHGIIFQDHADISRIVFCFLREIREWLIKHKDENDYGIDLDLGNILDIGICRYKKDEGDDVTRYDINVNYCIQYGPGQEFKVASKDDDSTEGDK